MPHLYTSIPFQSFIKGIDNYERIAVDFRKKEGKEMAGEFLAAFPDHIYLKTSEHDEEEIAKNLNYFNYALVCFETFEGICKINADFFDTFEKGTEDLMGDLRDMNDFYTEYYESKGFEVSQKEFFTNPFLILLDWCRAEILDLHAIIEAIGQHANFNKGRKKALKKYENELKSLQASKAGKKKLSQILSPRSVKEQEHDIEHIESEIKALDLTYKIMTCQLIHKDFMMFKQQKAHKHEVILRTFSSTAAEEFEAIANQVKEIEVTPTITDTEEAV
jgi:archaellum component FlaC